MDLVKEILQPKQFFVVDEIPSFFALPLVAVTAFVSYKVLQWAIESKDSKGNHADEFGGPVGAFFMPIVLPVLVYFLYFGCNAQQCVSINPFAADFLAFKVNPLAGGLPGFWKQVFDAKILAIFTVYVFYHWVMYFILPGPWVEGTKLADKKGTRLLYRINGLAGFFVTLGLAVALVKFGVVKATFLYDNFIQLVTASIIFSFALSAYLFAYSMATVPYGTEDDVENPLHMLSVSGSSGYPAYDFWMGRTLNPRIGKLDLKYVCELRPGLILWVLINLSMLCKEYERTNGSVSLSMILVNVFQFYYVLDSAMSEQAILTSMDIITDGFGFMLAFGDLTWVPMTYTMQARYLVDHPVNLSWFGVAGIVMVALIGKPAHPSTAPRTFLRHALLSLFPHSPSLFSPSRRRHGYLPSEQLSEE